MVVVVSIIMMAIRLVKKLVYYVIGRVALTLFFGIGLMLILCAQKGVCLSAFTWPAYILVLVFLGIGIGLYGFLMVKPTKKGD